MSPPEPDESAESASARDADRHARVRPPDRTQLVGMFARVRRGPADDFTDLGLAVAVQHDDTELVRESTRLER